MLRVQDVPIHALGPPLAVPSPHVGAPGKGQHLRGSRPFQPTKSGPVRIVISSRPRGRGRGRPEPGKEAPPLSCSSGGVENGLETCLKENNLKRGLYINKISYSVIDLPLWVFNPIVNFPLLHPRESVGRPGSGPQSPHVPYASDPEQNSNSALQSQARQDRRSRGERLQVSPPRYREVILLL